MSLKILFMGDIVGKPGREAIAEHLPKLREKEKLDYVIANAENAAGGFGLTVDTAKELRSYGIDMMTMGNHTWDKKDIYEEIEAGRKIIRPANYPPKTIGKGYVIQTLDNGKRICTVNIMGRVFMEVGLDCPFQFSREFIKNYKLGVDFDALIIDVHAETTSEKLCLGHIFDGKASLVAGTHTQIPTADHHIMPKGTGYITDAGQCGFYDSSLGMTFESVLPRFEQKGKFTMQIASGPATMCGVIVELNDKGLCEKIKPIRLGGVLEQAS